MDEINAAKTKQLARAKFEAVIKAPDLKKNETKSEPVCVPASRVSWDFFKEVINVEDAVKWISSDLELMAQQPLDISVLNSWRKIALVDKPVFQKKTLFVTKILYDQLLETREILSGWDRNLLLSARLRSNPFETLRHAFFMNRAALKMANLDAILQFGLTDPKTQSDAKMVADNELFYFADVCAGPGGFSEYVLWRKQWEAKGFGFTLRNCDCDFNLHGFIAGTPESFEVHYGVKGDGDVLDPENVACFVKYVVENTDGKGVHLMMADGGVEVEDKLYQEDVCKSLYLAQSLVALGIVREGGNFVCKLFDVTMPFSVGLLYLMYCSFDKIAIHKPQSSRPANPERYLICKGKRRNDHTRSIYMYLAKCHEMLWNYNKNKKAATSSLDIVELVPILTITGKGSKFFEFIKASNDSLATSQIIALQKMTAYYKDQSLEEIRQTDCRQASLAYWCIPDVSRRMFMTKADSLETASDRFDAVRLTYKLTLLRSTLENLTNKMITEVFKSPFDWRFVVLGSGPLKRSRAFFYGIGGNKVMRFDDNVWRSIQFNITLPKDTCVYAELVMEVSIDLTEKVAAFHIIDGFILGGKDIRNLHYIQRYELCLKMAKSMNKPGVTDAVTVRTKCLTRLEHIGTIFEKIISPEMPSEDDPVPQGSRARLFPVDSSVNCKKFFHPMGLLFLKITKAPWLMAYCRQTGRKYWINPQTRESSFDCPESAVADFKHTTENRLVWVWDDDAQIDLINSLVDNPAANLTDKVHPKQIIDHVEKFLTQIVPPPTQIVPSQNQN